MSKTRIRTKTRFAIAGMVASLAVVASVLTGVSPAVAATTPPGSVIENVPAATSVFKLHDSAGHSMDTVKIVADPTTAGRFIAVYHWLPSGASVFSVGVATSTDLRTWTYARTLDTSASQPYLAFSPAPKNGPILVTEGTPNAHLRFTYWTTVSGFLGTGAPYTSFDAPKTLSTCAEGTPSIKSVTYANSSSTINNGSTIVVDHHYFSSCSTDREAEGTLTNFNTWTTAALPNVDTALTNAGAVGKHGDRDTFTYNGSDYSLFEGQNSATYDPGNWRPYLYNGTTAQQLNIVTPHGSTAFANPSVSMLTINGTPSILTSLFIPSEGAGTGESGELIYWQPVTSAVPSATKVLVLIEENHSLAQMQSGMPYLYSQAQQYGYATNYTALQHPSEPNYLAILGGSNMGSTSDHNPAYQTTGASAMSTGTGRTAKAYLESMTSNCQQANSGRYAARHNPWASFSDERTACNAADVPMGTTSSGALLTDINAGTLPNVGYMVPNLDNDAHDGTLATADAWLQGWFTKIYAGPDWQAGRLAIIVTADEDNGSQGNKVLTTVIHPSQNSNVVSTALTHYSLNQLLTQFGHESCLRNGCTAADMASAFGLPVS